MRITRRQLRRLIKEELQKSGSDPTCHNERRGATVKELSPGNYEIGLQTTAALRCRFILKSSGGKIKLTLSARPGLHSGELWEIVSKNPFSATAAPGYYVEEVNKEPYEPNGIYGFDHYKTRGELEPIIVVDEETEETKTIGMKSDLELAVSEKEVELHIKTSGSI